MQAEQKASDLIALSVSVAEIRHGLHVGRRLFSRITGFSERAIADWEGPKPLSGPSLLKMREVARLLAALRTVMREEFIGTWLDTPNPAFEGLKPVEVIERGEIDRIWRMVHEVVIVADEIPGARWLRTKR